MRWMCVLYEGDPTAGSGCSGPGWCCRGYRPADPGAEAALCWAWPHRHCRNGLHRTCYCDEAPRTGVA